MEYVCHTKHNGCAQNEQCPFNPGCLPRPHRLFDIDADTVIFWDERHPDYTEEEGRDCDDDGEDKAEEETVPLAELECAGAFFHSWGVVDGDDKTR